MFPSQLKETYICKEIKPNVWKVNDPEDRTWYEVSLEATVPVCSCWRFSNTKLPCRHMVLPFINTPNRLFDDLTNIPTRWHYKLHPVVNMDTPFVSVDDLKETEADRLKSKLY